MVGSELAHRLVERDQRAVVAELALDGQPLAAQLLQGLVEPLPGGLGGGLPHERRALPVGVAGVDRVGRHDHEVLRLLAAVDAAERLVQLVLAIVWLASTTTSSRAGPRPRRLQLVAETDPPATG